MKSLRRPAIGWLVTLSVILAFSVPAHACPFCSTQGQTLSGEVNQADFIVLGTMTNAKRDLNDFSKGTTELTIDTVVKPHPYLTGKKRLTIPRFIDAPADQSQFLVFCSLYNRPAEFPASTVASSMILGNFGFAQLDAYRGEPVPKESVLAEYLKGAIVVREKSTPEKLRFFFQYLDAQELVIGTDALMEFGNADYKDVRVVAKDLPAERILKWLKDPNTPPSRYGLYGLILGHCGKPSDAATVRALLDDSGRVYSSGLDGILAGYILLDPKAGWEYVTGILADPKKEFPVRYAGLKVLRFLKEYRPDVIPPEQILEAMKLLVAQPDMADLPIEDLRKWQQWDMAPVVLKYGQQDSHKKIPIVRRAILRFALSIPGKNAEATAFIAQARKDDPERVQFVEQMLKDEQPRPAATATAPTSGNAPASGGS
ncbi:MAG: hypothetical protein LC104_13210 [Bacteroidales bacterium]|nr:hypothetical protein [Bacteroidales bacterium]